MRARYYDPTLGSFVTEDPAFDGVNWYSYCEGNPVNRIALSGLEKIVISGGGYSKEKKDNNNYYYEFIDSAIKQINTWNSEDNEEEITWIIANTNWSDRDLANFKQTAKELNICLSIIISIIQLVL